jgi:hypothetical protein
MAGVFLIMHPSCSCCFRPSHHTHILGIGVALAAAAANAGAFVSLQAIGPSVSFVVIMWYYHAMAVAAAGAAFLATGTVWVTPSFSEGKWLLGIAAANFVGQLLLNRGFQRSGAASGAAINTQQVLYSYIWGLTILHQPLQLCAVVGSCSILAGVVAVSQERSYSQSTRELARERSLVALKHRLHTGKLSLLDRLRGRSAVKYKCLENEEELDCGLGDASIVIGDDVHASIAAGEAAEGAEGGVCPGRIQGLGEPLLVSKE